MMQIAPNKLQVVRSLAISGIYALLGSIVGRVGWGSVALAWAMLLMPALWVTTRSRGQAWLLALGYYLGASWTVIEAIRGFFEDDSLLRPYGLWLCAGILMSLPWAFFRFMPRRRGGEGGSTFRAREILTDLGGMIASGIIVMLPPFVLVGWSHPLYGVGSLLPGSGWIGIVLATIGGLIAGNALKQAVYTRGKHTFPAVIGLATGCGLVAALSLWLNSAYVPPVPPKEWAAIDTTFGKAPLTHLDKVRRHDYLIKELVKARFLGSKVFITPELAAGYWVPGTELGYQLAMGDDMVVFVGADIRTSRNTLQNSLLAITKHGFSANEVVSRQSVPVTMWNPLDPKDHVPSHWFRFNTQLLPTESEPLSAAFLLCYEEMSALSGYSSMLKRPDVLIVASNVWWAKDRESEFTQDLHTLLLARTFGIPRLKARNY